MTVNDQKSDNAIEPPSRFKMVIKRIAFSAFIIVMLVVLGDLGYSIYVRQAIKKWEQTVERDQDGVALGHREYSTGNGKAAVLFVHGINDSPMGWKKMAPLFADAGFHCRVMRLPGFAESVYSYRDNADLNLWLTKIEEEVDILKESYDKVFIVAHSLGGALTINYLFDNQSNIERVALIAPAVKVSSARSPIGTADFWFNLSHYILHFTTITKSPFDIDVKDPNEIEFPYRSPFTPRKAIAETYRVIRMNHGRASELEVPVITCVTPNDIVVDTDAALAYSEQFSSQIRQKVVCERSGHKIPVDYDHKVLSDQIITFFKAALAKKDASVN